MSGKKYIWIICWICFRKNWKTKNLLKGKMESFGKVKEESNDEGNVYWIAENFEEFWKMLKNY